MDATVAKVSSLETKDGECLTTMKSEIVKKADGVFYKDEKLSYHEKMDSAFKSVRKAYIGRLKRNIKKDSQQVTVLHLIILAMYLNLQ